MFKSEFCEVSYLKKENVILLKWEKFCKGKDYREPLYYVLELLQKNKNSNFICDARNGFEDDKEDIKWAFDEFIPKMCDTDCKKVVFVTNVINNIQGEIDMFTNEFKKYFEVKEVISIEDAFNEIDSPIVLNVFYTVMDGKRDEFYNAIKEEKIPEMSRAETGNFKYDYYFFIEDENKILLIEEWKDKSSLDIHKESSHFKKLQLIKEKYVTDVKFEEYVHLS